MNVIDVSQAGFNLRHHVEEPALALEQRQPPYVFAVASMHQRRNRTARDGETSTRKNSSGHLPRGRRFHRRAERQRTDVAISRLRALDRAVDRLRPSLVEVGAEREHLSAQLVIVARELERLTAAIVAGGELATLMEAIKAREATKVALERQVARLDAQAALRAIDPAAVRAQT